MTAICEDVDVTRAEVDEHIRAVAADFPAVTERIFPLIRWCGCCGVPVVPERFKGLKRKTPEPYAMARAGSHPLAGADGLPVLQFGTIEVRGQQHEACRACCHMVRSIGYRAARVARLTENAKLLPASAGSTGFRLALPKPERPTRAATPGLFAVDA
jgi:hypothetical protein